MVTQQEFDLVEKRLEAADERFILCVIGLGNFTKDQRLEHIKAKDEVGRELAEVQLFYMRMMKERGR